MSDEQKSKEICKRLIEVLDEAFKNINKKIDKGVPLKYSEEKFLKEYEDIRKGYLAIRKAFMEKATNEQRLSDIEDKLKSLME